MGRNDEIDKAQKSIALRIPDLLHSYMHLESNQVNYSVLYNYACLDQFTYTCEDKCGFRHPLNGLQ